MSQAKIRLLLLLVILAGLPWVARWIWLKAYLARSEQAVTRLAEEVASQILLGGVMDETVYRNFIAQEPRISYLVVANYKTGYRTGVTSPQALARASKELERFLRENGTAETLNHLTQPGKGFAGEYLHVVAAAFVPEHERSDTTPWGILKVGYVVPGSPSFGRGYVYPLWGWTVLIGILCMIVTLLPARPLPQPMPDILDEMALLENELSKPEIFEEAPSLGGWQVLFDGESLAGWKPKGVWYVTEEEELAGRPWGASIVRSGLELEKPYIFQVQAKKIAGPDGFVVLFVCDGRAVSWILGGWRNSRSELAGYPGTARHNKIERNTWYQIEVRVGSDMVEGYLSGELQWKIARAEIQGPSPSVGFQEGLGVAIWSTLARFRDIRMSST